MHDDTNEPEETVPTNLRLTPTARAALGFPTSLAMSP